jgi:glycosyltransferase involved in cell wall biosynthesis
MVLSSQSDELIPGLTLSPGILNVYNEEVNLASGGAHSLPPDPHEPGQLFAFIEWLKGKSQYSVTGLPRYMEAVYWERAELQELMPEVQDGELEAFALWAELHGRSESSNILLLGHKISTHGEVQSGGRVSNGTDVIGMFHAEDGIGQSGRLLVESLRSCNTAVSTVTFKKTESRQGNKYLSDDVGRYKVVISAVNAELVEPVQKKFGSYFFQDTYKIGQWFWELETAPTWYKDAYKFVDELWAPTQFIREMLQRDAPRDVVITHMPLSLQIPKVDTTLARTDFRLDGRFFFLFVFDFRSVMKRKNPLGLVAAFRSAFQLNEGPVLVIKCVNGEKRPAEFSELLSAVKGMDDIVVINEYFEAEKSAALMNLCDCYVSLHRSEGLGLTIAEAMLLGKPVIATGYSGNLDFMSPDTSYLVPWKRVKVGKGAEAYSSRATWAEPNIEVAAEMMRSVYENPEQARAKALSGQRDLEQRFGHEIVGARMKARLEEIWETFDGE